MGAFDDLKDVGGPKKDGAFADLWMPRPPTLLERIGSGAANIAQGTKQLGLGAGEMVGAFPPGTQQAYTQEVKSQQDLYNRGFAQGRPNPPTDWARIGGEAAMTAPAALVSPVAASPLTRAIINGLAGGTAGGLGFASDAGERLLNTLGGAAGGAGASYLMDKAVVPAITGARGLFRQAKELGHRLFAGITGSPIDDEVLAAARAIAQQTGQNFDQLAPQAQQGIVEQIRAQMGQVNAVDPDAVARKLLLDEWGLSGTTGQVTRSPQQWAVERNLAKIDVGDNAVNPLETRFSEQNRRLKEIASGRAQDAPLRITAEAPDAYALGLWAQRIANMRARLSQRRVGKKYDAARGMIDADTPIPLDDYAGQWKQAREEMEDLIPGPVKNRIDEFFKAENPRPFTPAEAEKAIQLINRRLAALGPTDKQTRKGLEEAMKIVRGPVDDIGEVLNDSAEQAFRIARQAAHERFTMLRPKYVQDLLTESVPPEKVVDRFVVSGEIGELDKLFKFFKGGREKEQRLGQFVLEGLRRKTDEWLYRQATGKADEVFSGTNYEAALQRLGKSKLEVIFGADGAAKRFNFGKAAAATTKTPAGSAVNFSNTAPTLISYMNRIGSKIPVVSDMTNMLAGLVRQGQEDLREAAQRRAIDQALKGRYVTPEFERMQKALELDLRRYGDLLVPGSAAAGQTGLSEWLSQ